MDAYSLLRTGTAAAALALLVTAVGAPVAAAHPPRHRLRPRVVKVSDPPLQAKRRFTLRVRLRGGGRIALYAGTKRRHTKHDVRLARGARIRKGKVRVSLPGRLRPGAYFVIACPARGHGRCAASRRAMVKTPAKAPKAPTATTTVATSRAATATIGATGGSLAATAPDGTRIALALPAGSVPAGTTVTMTPVTKLAGAGSLGRLVTGVRLEPAGTPLLHGGAIVFRPRHPPKADQAVMAAFDGARLDRVGFRPTRKRGGFGTRLGSLGGVVLLRRSGQAASASVRAATAGGSSLTGFYEQLLGQEIADGAPTSALVSTLEDWHMDIIQGFPEAKADDDAGEQFIADLLAWAQDGALAIGDGHVYMGGYDASGEWQFEDKFDGMSKYFASDLTHHNWELEQVFSYIRPVVEKMYDRAQKRCADDHDLSQVTRVHDLALRLLDLDVDVPEQDITACQHFKVDFDSSITVQESGGSYSFEYAGHLNAEPGIHDYEGSAPGTYVKASGSDRTGTATFTLTHGNGSTIHVAGIEPPASKGAGAAVTLDPGSPTESYHVHDDVSGKSFDVTEAFWVMAFKTIHQGSAVAGGYRFPLDPGSGAVLGEHTFTYSGGGANESTRVTLTHVPRPFTEL